MSELHDEQSTGAVQSPAKTLLRVVVVVLAAAAAGALAMWKPGTSGQEPEPVASVGAVAAMTPLVLLASAEPASSPSEQTVALVSGSPSPNPASLAIYSRPKEPSSAPSSKASPAPDAVPQGVTQVEYKLLLQTKTRLEPPPQYPDELKKLEGQRVRIGGFMTPLDSMDDMTNFMLLETPVGCFFCSPPDPTTVILVRQKPAKKAPFLYDPVAVEGVLHLWKQDPNDPMLENFLYTLDQATVAPEGEGK